MKDLCTSKMSLRQVTESTGVPEIKFSSSFFFFFFIGPIFPLFGKLEAGGCGGDLAYSKTQSLELLLKNKDWQLNKDS